MTKETMERAAALMKTLQALNEISKELHAPLPEITAGTFGVQSCSRWRQITWDSQNTDLLNRLINAVENIEKDVELEIQQL